MRATMTSIVSIILMLMISNPTMAAQDIEGSDVPTPAVKLIEATGDVEYSRDGTSWKPVTRAKYLFAGYRIRTGKNGSARLVSQKTGETHALGARGHVVVDDGELRLVQGKLSELNRSSEGFLGILESITNKFMKAQRYMTVRRGMREQRLCDPKVKTAASVTLSGQYPDLVWRNACPEHHYRLVIDGSQVHQVPAQSTAEMIRFPIHGAAPGSHAYRVEVQDRDGVVYIPRRDSAFTWLSLADESELAIRLEKAAGDVFVVSELFDSIGMKAAAMDTYRDYVKANPDDHEMRPLLINAYAELQLVNLKESELRLYRAWVRGRSSAQTDDNL